MCIKLEYEYENDEGEESEGDREFDGLSEERRVLCMTSLPMITPVFRYFTAFINIFHYLTRIIFERTAHAN